MKRIIYINGRFLTQPATGVQRYAHEIVANFDAMLDNNELSKEACIRCLVPPGTPRSTSWKNITFEEVGVNQGNLWEQIDLPLYLKGEFLFSPANIGPFLYQNQAITFHDASVFAIPHAYSFWFRLKYRIIFKSLARLAKVIFTVSEFSQSELSQYLKYPSEKFKVTYQAGGHIDRIQADTSILSRHNLLKGGYVFMVGSQSPHKNLVALCNALEFINSDTKLVFAGAKHQKIFNMEGARARDNNIIALGYITDEELKALYLNALCFVFPSYYEGFGLPILEAMHCGCPVLCARAGSLPEVAGDASLFFDPMDVRHIASAINRSISDPQLRNNLIQKGYQRAKDFSWRATASQTMDALLAVTKDHP
ncbi:MAG TPA: glycosyltransferase family 1 protein [Anaerolineales bacterium]|nr:glycosyltransferase family 1 protein [Anaerolineales bacterium]